MQTNKHGQTSERDNPPATNTRKRKKYLNEQMSRSESEDEQLQFQTHDYTLPKLHFNHPTLTNSPVQAP